MSNAILSPTLIERATTTTAIATATATAVAATATATATMMLDLHTNHELTCPQAAAVPSCGLQWAAFFGDVEHQAITTTLSLYTKG